MIRCVSQFLTRKEKFWSDPTVSIVCAVGSAQTKPTNTPCHPFDDNHHSLDRADFWVGWNKQSLEFGSAENETVSNNFQDSLGVGADNFTYNKLPIPITHCSSGPFRSFVVLASGTGLVLARSLVCATRPAHAHLATARARQCEGAPGTHPQPSGIEWPQGRCGVIPQVEGPPVSRLL